MEDGEETDGDQLEASAVKHTKQCGKSSSHTLSGQVLVPKPKADELVVTEKSSHSENLGGSPSVTDTSEKVNTDCAQLAMKPQTFHSAGTVCHKPWPEGDFQDPDCMECGLMHPDPTPDQLLIYLHALRYKVNAES